MKEYSNQDISREYDAPLADDNYLDRLTTTILAG
jgi:hypothetical protein